MTKEADYVASAATPILAKDAVLFVDVELNPSPRDLYRERHFAIARSLGLRTLVVGVKGRVRPISQELMDEVFLLDCLSVSAILKLIKQLEQRYHVRAVFGCAGMAASHGDAGVLSAGVSRELGLISPSPLSIASCNDKSLMRRSLEARAVRSVKYALCYGEQDLKQYAEKVGYPLVAKPPYGGGSAFVKKCLSWSDLQEHYDKYLDSHGESAYSHLFGPDDMLVHAGGPASRCITPRPFLIEEYLDGLEGSVECVIADGIVYPILIHEKIILSERSHTILEDLLITPPVSFSDADCEAIRNYAVECIEAVGLTNAVAHLEFRFTRSGPTVIEINPRLGGLYVDAALQQIGGIDPYKTFMSLILGAQNMHDELNAGMRRTKQFDSYRAMMVLYPDTPGVFRGITGEDFLEQCEFILHYGQQATGSSVNPDIEENYLLKCWASVKGGDHACALYKEVLRRVKLIL